jgi:hypothetical protein
VVKHLLPLVVLAAATLSSHGQSNLDGNTATLALGLDASLSSLPSLLPIEAVYGPTTIGLATPTFSDTLLDVNVSGNTITFADHPSLGLIAIAFGTESTNGEPVAFNGFVFTDLTEPLADATLANSTVSGFTTSDFSIADGALWVNFAGLVIPASDQISITLEAAPEPSTWVLLLMGCAAVPFIRRRASRVLKAPAA